MSTGEHLVDGLEIGQDLPFERRDQHVQRYAWIGMAALMLAGLAGLLGHGPLSSTSAQSSNLRVDYSRFERFETPSTLDITGQTQPTNGEVRIWLDRAYAEQIDLQEIVPQPDHVETSADRLTYVFDAPQQARSLEVRFRFRPDQAGLLHARIGAAGSDGVTFWQFVYP